MFVVRFCVFDGLVMVLVASWTDVHRVKDVQGAAQSGKYPASLIISATAESSFTSQQYHADWLFLPTLRDLLGAMGFLVMVDDKVRTTTTTANSHQACSIPLPSCWGSLEWFKAWNSCAYLPCSTFMFDCAARFPFVLLVVWFLCFLGTHAYSAPSTLPHHKCWGAWPLISGRVITNFGARDH